MVKGATFLMLAVCALSAAPLVGALEPISVEVHVNLTPDGGFSTGMGEWETFGCGPEEGQGVPAPAVGCGFSTIAGGEVFCPPPPYDPGQCNSHAEFFGGAAIARNVTLPPVYVGQVGAGHVQRYEISLDYRLIVNGQVMGSQDNRNGNVNAGISAFFASDDGQNVFHGVGLGGNGAGACCGQYSFGSDSGWQSSPRTPVSGLADHSGETIQVGVFVSCDGRADQFGSDEPVALEASCTALIDNVRFDVYYTVG